MHQGKPLTCGEGGAAITNDHALFDRMEQLRANGRRYTTEAPRFGHPDLQEIGTVLGSNRALSELHAAILLDGMDRLEEQNRQRELNARYLDRMLAQSAWIPIGRPQLVEQQTYYHYLVRMGTEQFAGRTAAEVGEAISAELGFWAHPVYPPTTRHPLYRPQSKRRYRWSEEYWEAINPARFNLPRAEEVYGSSLVFHHSVLLGSQSDMDAVATAFAKVQREADRIPRRQ
jgi:dTDP-4-amino-4,6-dideoxygalactose transaminase